MGQPRPRTCTRIWIGIWWSRTSLSWPNGFSCSVSQRSAITLRGSSGKRQIDPLQTSGLSMINEANPAALSLDYDPHHVGFSTFPFSYVRPQRTSLRGVQWIAQSTVEQRQPPSGAKIKKNWTGYIADCTPTFIALLSRIEPPVPPSTFPPAPGFPLPVLPQRRRA
jgi:hypothetical protein